MRLFKSAIKNYFFLLESSKFTESHKLVPVLRVSLYASQCYDQINTFIDLRRRNVSGFRECYKHSATEQKNIFFSQKILWVYRTLKRNSQRKTVELSIERA